MNLTDLYNRISKVKANYKSYVATILNLDTTKRWIIQVIQDRLEYEGKDNKGKKLRTDMAIAQGNAAYSDYTIKQKQKWGDPVDKVTLKNTGNFYRSFKITVAKQTFKIYAETLKQGFKNGESTIQDISENFQRMYPSDKDFYKSILNLNDFEQKALFDQILRPKIIENIQKIINNG